MGDRDRPITRAQLRGLRRLIARVEGIRHSQVRVVLRAERVCGVDMGGDHVEVSVRTRRDGQRTDWFAFSWSATRPRGVVRRIARRCAARDLP